MATERSDDRYDLVFAPARYAPLNADADGRWSVLASSDNVPLGISWTDGEDAAGFIQTMPNALGEDIWSDFSVAASMKVSAPAVYQMSLAKRGITAREEQTGKLSEVYRLLSTVLDETTTLTAAAARREILQKSEDEDSFVPEGAHLFLTVTDEDENVILEFVRSDETGMYIRDNSQWVPIDAEADNPRVWDRTIIDVTSEAIPLFDEAERDDSLAADLFDGVLELDEETQQ